MKINILQQLFHGESGSYNTVEFVNQGILTEDTVVYLSITESIANINEKIANIPHNLNGHNLAFIFVVPKGYTNSEDTTNVENTENTESYYYEYSLNVGDQCIKFSNFFSGTLFVFGDFLAGSKIISNGVEVQNFPPYTKKTIDQINDPVNYDNIVPSLYIEKLYKEIEQPQSIDKIIEYNSEDAKTNVTKPDNLNKIAIKGTCLNQNYSLMCFSDVTAKTYIKNLKFVNVLKANEDGVIDITEELNANLPSKDQIMLQYPFNEDLKPIVYDPLFEYLETVSNEPYFNLVKDYIHIIDNEINYLSSLMLNEDSLIGDSDYASLYVNDSVMRTLESQAEEIRSVPGVERRLGSDRYR